MVRLNVTRKEKARRRQVGSQLGSLTHFGDISALTGAAAPLGEVSLGLVWVLGQQER